MTIGAPWGPPQRLYSLGKMDVGGGRGPSGLLGGQANASLQLTKGPTIASQRSLQPFVFLSRCLSLPICLSPTLGSLSLFHSVPLSAFVCSSVTAAGWPGVSLSGERQT